MIPVFSPLISSKDIFHVLKNLLKNNLSGSSPIINDFEEQFSNKFENRNAIAVSNGSVALDIAMNMLDLKNEDEVIVPSFTIISCLSAILRSGARPVFCDVDLNSWNMTIENVMDAYSVNTKAILVVHTYGLPADILQIKKFCDEKNLILIEDTAEAHGLRVGQKFCGTFGSVSTFSFYANKHITTGEGGMILTNSKTLEEKAKKMRNLDFNSNKTFIHENLYWNYRLGGLQAALGISQLKKLDSTINFKKKQGSYYSKLFEKYQNLIQTPLESYLNTRNHYWVYGIVLKIDEIRDLVIEDLKKEGIETRPFFYPLHLQPALPSEYRSKKNLLNTEHISRNGFYIPMGKHVSFKMQNKIVNTIIKSINKFV